MNVLVVFWGLMATLFGAGIAVLLNGVWWAGAIIGLIVYLIVLAFIYSGGNGPTIFFIDLD